MAQTVKASAYNVGDLGSIPGLGRSPGEGNGNPFQYSCLENPMDGGAWQAAALGVANSQTQLSDQTTTTKAPSLQCFAKADPRADTGTMGCPPHLRLV